MQDFHHRWVRATYGVASAYVLADTYDKGVKQSKVMISSCLSGLQLLLYQGCFSAIISSQCRSQEPIQVKLLSPLWILCCGRPWLQLLSQVLIDHNFLVKLTSLLWEENVIDQYFCRFHNKPDMLGCRPRSCQSSTWGGCDCKKLDGHRPWSWGYPTYHSPYWQVSVILRFDANCNFLSGVHVAMDNTTRKLIGGVPRKQEWLNGVCRQQLWVSSY